MAAVVTEDGHPAIAARWLARVTSPTLLLVRAGDIVTIGLNAHAAKRAGASCELAVVPGADPLVKGPGTVAEVARLTTGWFLAHFGASNREHP